MAHWEASCIEANTGLFRRAIQSEILKERISCLYLHHQILVNSTRDCATFHLLDHVHINICTRPNLSGSHDVSVREEKLSQNLFCCQLDFMLNLYHVHCTCVYCRATFCRWLRHGKYSNFISDWETKELRFRNFKLQLPSATGKKATSFYVMPNSHANDTKTFFT